jgi:hypothetical protein
MLVERCPPFSPSPFLTERQRKGGKSCFLPTYWFRPIFDCLRANVVSSEHDSPSPSACRANKSIENLAKSFDFRGKQGERLRIPQEIRATSQAKKIPLFIFLT